MTKIDIEEMLNHNFIEKKDSTNSEETIASKNLSEGLRMINVNFVFRKNPFMEISLFLKATAEYQYELRDLLKASKQE